MPQSRSISTLGDPRWYSTSPRFAAYAPLVVLSLLILAILQIVLGGVWVANLKGQLDFLDLLQPIVLPSLSLFNTIPSAQWHLVSRSNHPVMAICFSTLMALLYLASAVVSLAACSATAAAATPSAGSSRRAVCPTANSGELAEEGDGSGASISSGGGPSQSEWDAVVALWLCSVVGYLTHIAMASRVRWVLKMVRAREVVVVVEEEGRLGQSAGDGVALEPVTATVALDPEAKAREEQDEVARDRWRRIGGL